MPDVRHADLTFDLKLNKVTKKKELRHGLSVAFQKDNTLWVANDETISLERLTFQESGDKGSYSYDRHTQFLLKDYLSLPKPFPDKDNKFEEVDIEGLDFHDGYMWLAGSHSLKRPKVDSKDSEQDKLKNLSRPTADGNRFLLARIPIVEEGGVHTLKKSVETPGGPRIAAQLRGDIKGNDLTRLLEKDEILGPFLSIPGKDNGFDIEGLAIADERIFIGLRGPVLRGWAVILELKLKEGGSPDQPELELDSVRKHFLELGGLGIRDLIKQDSDLLILAGPTMDLDGPVSVFRWADGINAPDNSFVFRDRLTKVRDIPYGQGDDHAEGMTLFASEGNDQPAALLVVFDAASRLRQFGPSSVKADIFSLG